MHDRIIRIYVCGPVELQLLCRYSLGLLKHGARRSNDPTNSFSIARLSGGLYTCV